MYDTFNELMMFLINWSCLVFLLLINVIFGFIYSVILFFGELCSFRCFLLKSTLTFLLMSFWQWYRSESLPLLVRCCKVFFLKQGNNCDVCGETQGAPCICDVSLFEVKPVNRGLLLFKLLFLHSFNPSGQDLGLFVANFTGSPAVASCSRFISYFLKRFCASSRPKHPTQPAAWLQGFTSFWE